MSEPSLIESYLDAMRGLLKLKGSDADRILEEAEDHLTQAVLEGVEAGLSFHEAEAAAIAHFGLPHEICGRFRRVYRPWYRRPLPTFLAAVFGGLAFTAFTLTVGLIPILIGALPVFMGAVSAYQRRSARAGVAPGLTACAVSCALWLLCALPYALFLPVPGHLSPISVVESYSGFLMMAVLLIHLAASAGLVVGGAVGANLRRRREALLA